MTERSGNMAYLHLSLQNAINNAKVPEFTASRPFHLQIQNFCSVLQKSL